MSSAARYSYKPAPLQRAVQYRLDGEGLQSEAGEQIDLAEVKSAAFSSQVMKGSRFARLDLWTEAGRQSLSYSAPARGWTSTPDARAFLSLARDVLRQLAEINPALDVTLGAKGGPRIAMFLVGLLSILAGGGIFVGALASGVSGDRLIAATLPMALLVALGGLLAVSFNPWRKSPVAKPAAVANMIEGMIEKLPDTADPEREG